jgi:TRAP-type mannitol/chloroaromatic compound transport system permease small subunit
MHGLRKCMLAVEKTNIFIGKVMVCVLGLAVLVISFEVGMRYLFGRPTNWGHESMVLLLAILYVILGGYCHYYRAHVRVDVFYSSRSPRTRAVLDVTTSLFFFFYAVTFTYTSWNFYWSSQTMLGGGTIFGIDVPGEMSFTDWGPPLYGVKFMMPLGGLLLLLQGLVWFIRDLHMAATGRDMR